MRPVDGSPGCLVECGVLIVGFLAKTRCLENGSVLPPIPLVWSPKERLRFRRLSPTNIFSMPLGVIGEATKLIERSSVNINFERDII